jgi:fatty acid desaturase
MRDSAEWRTLLLIAICYALWASAVFFPIGIPEWVRIGLIVPLVTFHSSLQHECMHGHPFRSQSLNDAIVWPPIGILVPYPRFKSTHLNHHRNENIADPYDDPESWYLDKDVWRRKPEAMKRIFELNNTLVGRMVLGPAIGMFGFLTWEWNQLKGGKTKIAAEWVVHVLAAGTLLVLIALFGQISVGAYLTCAYAGMGLLMVRTFLEHQAHERAGSRSVIIEDRGPLALLFLNNNLHSVHHAYPAIAWYRLPGFFRQNRDRFLKMNGGYRYANYGSIFRRFAFRRKEPVEYPLERRASRKP